MIVSISIFALAGCKAKDSSSTKNANATQRGFRNGNFDPSTFKQKYEDALKSLVTDGKINQEQSDKVLEALTKNMGNFKAGNNGGKNGNGTDNSSSTAANDASKGSDNTNGQEKQGTQGQKNGRNNQLAELVTSKVITQAQADEIMQKIRGTMTPPQGQQDKTNQPDQTSKQ